LEFFRGKGVLRLEFWNSSRVKGFELGILQGYNHEKHVSSTGGLRILNE
jgi:hypothetical protein